MIRKHRYTVACLAGDGIGPEVMAEASRALAHVSHLHGFHVDEIHVPFGGEALTRYGHLLPPSARAAYLNADAVLVAAAREQALEYVESELDLRASVTRVQFAQGGSLTLLSPLGDEAAEWTVGRAFVLARSSHGRIVSVDADDRWRDVIAETAARHDGVLVEGLTPAEALRGLAFEPERYDVVVASPLYGEALASVAASGASTSRVVASGRLAEAGPGIFTPAHGAARDIAGYGVANPSSMLLAAALMLGEGLGERSAAATLAGAVTEAWRNGLRTADMVGAGAAATTREFADLVLAELPGAVTNAEFYREAYV